MAIVERSALDFGWPMGDPGGAWTSAADDLPRPRWFLTWEGSRASGWRRLCRSIGQASAQRTVTQDGRSGRMEGASEALPENCRRGRGREGVMSPLAGNSPQPPSEVWGKSGECDSPGGAITAGTRAPPRSAGGAGEHLLDQKRQEGGRRKPCRRKAGRAGDEDQDEMGRSAQEVGEGVNGPRKAKARERRGQIQRNGSGMERRSREEREGGRGQGGGGHYLLPRPMACMMQPVLGVAGRRAALSAARGSRRPSDQHFHGSCSLELGAGRRVPRQVREGLGRGGGERFSASAAALPQGL